MPQCQFPVFCCFWFQKSCSGNILGIGHREDQSLYFSNTYPDSEGESKKARGVATPCLGAGPPLAAPRLGVGPPGAHRHRPSAYLFRSSGNPKYPSLHPRNVPQPPSLSTLVREGSEGLPGTLSEREIITGGLLHHHACLRSDA